MRRFNTNPKLFYLPRPTLLEVIQNRKLCPYKSMHCDEIQVKIGNRKWIAIANLKRLNTVKFNLRLFCSSSFKFQTRNFVTCFDHICNYPYGQENSTQKYINTVLITV